MSRKLLSVLVAAMLVVSMAGVGAATSQSQTQNQTVEQENVEIDAETINHSGLEDVLGDYITNTVFSSLFGGEFADEIDRGDNSSNETPAEPSDPPADDGDEADAPDEDTDEPEPEPEPEEPTDGTDDTDETDDSESDDSAEDSDSDSDADADSDWSELELAIHQQINEERTDRGLDPLEADDDLQSVADGHSQDMAERDYFSHDSPEGDSFSDRYDEAGIEYRTGAENIAWDTDATAERIVSGWMESDGHRENILSSDYERQGIGAHSNGDRTYVTQNFAG